MYRGDYSPYRRDPETPEKCTYGKDAALRKQMNVAKVARRSMMGFCFDARSRKVWLDNAMVTQERMLLPCRSCRTQGLLACCKTSPCSNTNKDHAVSVFIFKQKWRTVQTHSSKQITDSIHRRNSYNTRSCMYCLLIWMNHWSEVSVWIRGRKFQ